MERVSDWLNSASARIEPSPRNEAQSRLDPMQFNQEKYHPSNFFFAGRRRHTRWPRAWSSDVCSSDLAAIAYGWDPADPGLTGDLLAQEVMFPFSAAERSGIADEVQQLLAGYRAMLGSLLPSVADREHDEAELPVAISHAGTVWQGTIDRLYLASGQWWLDDYKTDVRPDPDAYLSQLAIYALAARQRLGFYPRVRLVWLRSHTLTELAEEALERALAELGQDEVPEGASGP